MVSLLSCPPPAPVSSRSFGLRALAAQEAAWPQCASSQPALPASPHMFLPLRLLQSPGKGNRLKNQTLEAVLCMPDSWAGWMLLFTASLMAREDPRAVMTVTSAMKLGNCHLLTAYVVLCCCHSNSSEAAS